MAPIKAVLLDLGNVVLELDIAGSFLRLGIPDPWSVFSSWDWHKNYEKGRCTSLEFQKAVEEKYHLSFSATEFELTWGSMIVGIIPGVERVLAEISAKKIQLWALSNTNSLHVKRFEAFAPMKNFAGIFASCGMGHRKPEPEIYKEAVDSLGLSASEVLLVDDLHENLIAAKNLGINTEHCFHSSERLLEIMKKYEILV